MDGQCDPYDRETENRKKDEETYKNSFEIRLYEKLHNFKNDDEVEQFLFKLLLDISDKWDKDKLINFLKIVSHNFEKIVNVQTFGSEKLNGYYCLPDSEFKIFIESKTIDLLTLNKLRFESK